VFAVLLIVAGGAAAGYWYVFLRQPGEPLPFGLGSLLEQTPVTPAGPARPPTPTPRPVDASFARFDRLSDTLSRAVRNYQDRAALFANRQIDCAALARGLVAIERLWEVYNVQRRDVVGTLDPQRAGRDRRIYASVDSVERQFERSRCPRP
jgi:hypothetical protein